MIGIWHLGDLSFPPRFVIVIRCLSVYSAKTVKGKPYTDEQVSTDDTFSLERLESLRVSSMDSRIFWKILKSSPNLAALSVDGFVVTF